MLLLLNTTETLDTLTKAENRSRLFLLFDSLFVSHKDFELGNMLNDDLRRRLFILRILDAIDGCRIVPLHSINAKSFSFTCVDVKHCFLISGQADFVNSKCLIKISDYLFGAIGLFWL